MLNSWFKAFLFRVINLSAKYDYFIFLFFQHDLKISLIRSQTFNILQLVSNILKSKHQLLQANH